jgi:hypothetical protein
MSQWPNAYPLHPPSCSPPPHVSSRAEWALRRRVLQLANLRQKRTHSQQTDLSHFRRDNDTMVWLPKQSVTQTAKQTGTAMPQKKLFIQGLRGAPDVRMHVSHIDLDLGQDGEY